MTTAPKGYFREENAFLFTKSQIGGPASNNLVNKNEKIIVGYSQEWYFYKAGFGILPVK